MTDSAECIRLLEKYLDEIEDMEINGKDVGDRLVALNIVFKTFSPDEKVVCLDWLAGRLINCRLNR